MFRSLASALFAAAVSAAMADYTQNGANWPELCKFGKEQSPIDLTEAGATKNGRMELVGFNYYDFKVNSSYKADDPTYTTAFDNATLAGNAELQLTFADGSMSYFTPAQFHFHAPSEHSVNGKLYDLEIHFVHLVKGSNTAGNTAAPQDAFPGAVIGIFFDRQAGGNYENSFLESLNNAIVTKGASTPTTVDVREFLHGVDMSTYWSYDGSLTTPPCTEGLKWSVIKQVQPISDAQLTRFTQRMADNNAFAGGNGNNRVVQPLNARELFIAADVPVESGSTSLFAGAAMAVVAALAF